MLPKPSPLASPKPKQTWSRCFDLTARSGGTRGSFSANRALKSCSSQGTGITREGASSLSAFMASYGSPWRLMCSMSARDRFHHSSFLPDLQPSRVRCIPFKYGNHEGYAWATYTRKPRQRSSCLWLSTSDESSTNTSGGTSFRRWLNSCQMSWTILRVLSHCVCVTFTHTWSMLVWITLPAQAPAVMEGGRRFLRASWTP
jgi:hypothetical protein